LEGKVYLRQDVEFEPLFHGWYAWYLTVPPVTSALNLADRYLPIMKSYVASPGMHAAAVKNPAMRGGPFIDLGGRRVDDIKELVRDTTERSQHLLEFARALKQLWTLLLEKAKGLAMDSLYREIPEPLKGYVELYYDLNHNPSFRVFEGLLYRSPLYDESAQSIVLSAINGNARRPFILSTPRLPETRSVHLHTPFRNPGLDDLFRMRQHPASYSEVAESLGATGERTPLFRSFFSEEPAGRPAGRTIESGDMRIRYFGHACLLIQSRGINIMLDPVVSYGGDSDLPSFTFADLPDHIDYILITHSHHDHIVLETLLQLRHKVGTVVVGRNCDGAPQDPSMQLALRKLGFRNVTEVRDAEEIPIPNGSIAAIPFLGEHNDLPIQSKNAWFVRIGSRSALAIADSCNLDPQLYTRLSETIGEPDVLFLGMECEGAPPSWVYGPFFPKPLPRDIDRSRRARGCNLNEAAALLDHLRFKQVYVYAMGQEPWVDHILDNQFTEESPSLIQSRQFVDLCRARGIESENLFGTKELMLCQN
jgi:L-ascorbate metabolism protein UlaG (beta-lactamase superfamily)